MVAVIQAFASGAPLERLVGTFLVPVLLGLSSAFVVLAVLPILEFVLGELSDVTLVEYASEHPLLDRLKEEAPGTWHHSLSVADLAEKGAAVIGARALFCRTAALYHDIGKVNNPSIFAENIQGPSPHEALDPRESAARIIEHVTGGLELAREHRLPKPFRDIIAEHHGTSVIRFFYAKACAQLTSAQDPEALRPLFQYPGPPAASRESGIIALADAVEAATRSFTAKSDNESKAFVRKIIADRLSEGELAHCSLTLAELAQVEETFVRWVQARDHHRPRYPVTTPAPDAASQWARPGSAAQPA